MILILIVVDDGLVQPCHRHLREDGRSLNPYCSGRWSRTTPLEALREWDIVS